MRIRFDQGATLWVDPEGNKYVEVQASDATVIHEEHRPITLPGPAVYRVIQQREYAPKAHVDRTREYIPEEFGYMYVRD